MILAGITVEIPGIVFDQHVLVLPGPSLVVTNRRHQVAWTEVLTLSWARKPFTPYLEP
jgi:hypothetical protein